MSEDIAKLGIQVKSDQIVKATKRLDKLEKQSKQNVKAAKKVGGAFKGLGAILGAAGIGLAMKSVISATIEQERVIAQLESALKSTGGKAGKTSEELQKLASSLQDVTTFGDETIIAGEALLLTFTKIQGDVLPRTIDAMLDMSQAMGTDLKSSAIQLGKALNDPATGLTMLTRSGITFSEEQKKVIKSLQEAGDMAGAQSVILKELETQFGGSAKAARDTFGGALEGLKNAFGDLLEGTGGNLDDAKGAIEELTAVLQDPATKKAFATLTFAVIALVSAFAKGIVVITEFSGAIGKQLSEDINGAIPSVRAIDSEIAKIAKRIQDIESSAEKSSFLSKLFGTEDETRSVLLDNLQDQLDDLMRKRDEVAARFGEPIAAVSGGVSDSGDTGGGDTGSGVQLTFSDEEIEAQDAAQAAETERIESGLEMMRSRNATEFELNEIRYLNERDLLKEAMEAEIGDKEEHAAALVELEEDRADAVMSLRELEKRSMLSLAQGALGALESLMESGSKKQFKIAKKAAIANAIINTYQAVASGLKTDPFFPVGIAMGAIALVAGIATIKKIKSQQYGGGSAASSTLPSASAASAGGGVTPSGSQAPPGQQGNGQAAPPQELRVVVEGDAPGSEAMRQFVENLADTIEDMGGVGRLTVST